MCLLFLSSAKNEGKEGGGQYDKELTDQTMRNLIIPAVVDG